MHLSNFSLAQSNELKGWSSVEYGFDINEVLKINLSQHFRLKEDLSVIDTYITESDISFEPIKEINEITKQVHKAYEYNPKRRRTNKM